MHSRLGPALAALGILVGVATDAHASMLQVRYQVAAEISLFGDPYRFGPAPPHGNGIIALLYQAPMGLPASATGAV